MKFVAVAALAMLIAGPLAAEELSAPSQIAGVTVFPRGAEVRRTIRLRIPQGDHVVVLRDLPSQAVANSIRVEGRSTGRLEIGAVDTRRLKIPRSDPAASQSERRRIELAIERAGDERDAIATELHAAEAQKALITKLVDLPAQPAPPATSATAQPDWHALYAMVGTRMAEAEKAALATRIKLRDADRRIADLKKALSGLAPLEDERTQVRVFVAAAAPLEADLTVSYQVSEASWASLYDGRLTSGARNAPPGLDIIRRAAIRQRSGEDWNDVSLILSTTRPGSGVAAPALASLYVDYAPDAPTARPMSMPAPAARVSERAGRASDNLRRVQAEQERERVAGEVRKEAIVETAAEPETGEFQSTFAISGKHTVAATGEVKRVQIDAARIEPTLVVRAVPRLQPHAYLYARIVVPRTSPYLPGPIALFRDGTFVGTGALPLLSPGQDHELGFGIDDAVRVRHAVTEDKRGEAGLISASRTDTRSFRITIKNQHQRPIALVVMDHIPTSRQQDIKVELTGRTAPARRDVDDQRGVLAWEAKLEPDEERQIEYGYRLSWPGGKRIIYGR